jgi:hypothetical protein
VHDALVGADPAVEHGPEVGEVAGQGIDVAGIELEVAGFLEGAPSTMRGLSEATNHSKPWSRAASSTNSRIGSE